MSLGISTKKQVCLSLSISKKKVQDAKTEHSDVSLMLPPLTWRGALQEDHLLN